MMMRLLLALLLHAAVLTATLGEDSSCTADVHVEAEPVQAHALLQKQRRAGREVLEERAPGTSLDKDLNELPVRVEQGTNITASGTAFKQLDEIEGPGAYEPLSESGYKTVAATCCNYQMEEFIRRVIDDLGLELCFEGGLMGMVPFYTCDKGLQDYSTLRQELLDKVHADCPIAVAPGTCAKDDSACPGAGVSEPSQHRRRNCKASASTTATATTTTGKTTRTRTTTTKTTTTVTTTTTTTATTTTTTTTTTTIITAPTTSTGCRSTTDLLDIFDATLEHTNLGGAGPSGGVPNIRYEGVGESGGKSFDMVVETVGSYAPANNLDNGFECGQPSAGCVNGHFAQVSVAVGTSVDLKISFQESDTQAPITLSRFLFSVHDIDQFSSNLKERVYIGGFADGPILGNSTEVGVHVEADGRTRLSSTKDGTACDDPVDPVRLGDITCSGTSIDQRKRSAAFVFQDKSEISLTLEVTCNGCDPSVTGRSFLFTGDTSLVQCGRA